MKAQKNTIKHFIEYYSFKTLLLFVRVFGIRVFRYILLGLATLLIFVFYAKVKKRIRLAKYNLNIMGFSDFKPWRLLRSFVRFLESFVEITLFKEKIFESKKFDITLHNPQILQKIKDSGKGCIIVSFHYGNWELAPMYFQKKYDMKNYFIYKEQQNKLIDDVIMKARMGISNVFALKKGAKDIASIPSIVADGGSICVLIDQKQHIGSEPINLFNKQVKIGFTIQKIAIKHNIPIVPVFCFLDRGFDKTKYSMYVHEPILAKDPVTKENLVKITQDATQQIVDIATTHIKHDPYQWFCLLHRLFDNPPKEFK
jgi:lauroyl/myristoyl acyltransferase